MLTADDESTTMKNRLHKTS